MPSPADLRRRMRGMLLNRRRYGIFRCVSRLLRVRNAAHHDADKHDVHKLERNAVRKTLMLENRAYLVYPVALA